MNPISLYGHSLPTHFGKGGAAIQEPDEPRPDDVELALAGLEGLLIIAAEERNKDDDTFPTFSGNHRGKNWLG